MEQINTKTKQNNNSKNNYEIESGTKKKVLKNNKLRSN